MPRGVKKQLPAPWVTHWLVQGTRVPYWTEVPQDPHTVRVLMYGWSDGVLTRTGERG